MKPSPTFAIALLALTACEKPTTIQRAQSDQVQSVAQDDPEMLKAFARASASLDDFFRLAASPPPGTSMFGVKVRVSDGVNTEYFWVNTLETSAGSYTGILGNEPRTVKKYKFGERFAFRREEIVDWTYLDERTGKPRTEGNFTACALLTKEPPEQAREYKERYGLACPE